MADSFRAEYERLGHAIQTGVAYKMEHGSNEAAPKHLRTGLNCVMQDHASLAKLLIEKGVITDAEYKAALLDGLRREVALYEAELSTRYGVDIRLG